MYFNSSITVTQQSSIAITEQSGITKSRSLQADTLVTSNTELPPVLCTEPFFDSSKKEWSICAFINKKEAAAAYNAELTTGIQRIKQQLQMVQSAPVAFSHFKTIKSLCERTAALEKTQKKLLLLNTEQGSALSTVVSNLSHQCFSLFETLKQQASFSITIENDFENTITDTVQHILEEEGFSLGGNPQFLVTGAVTASESSSAAGYFVKPSLSIRIMSVADSHTVGVYSKRYKKWGHLDYERAYRKAFVEVEKDLQEHFTDIFR